MANVSVRISPRIHASRSERDGQGQQGVLRVVGVVRSRIWLFSLFVYAIEGDGAGVLRRGGTTCPPSTSWVTGIKDSS